MPFFYRDPNEDIQSPYVCRSCDCDPIGSLDDGICDSVSDAEGENVAGACHCKTHVKGRRCDICKEGYWNLTEANPDGCEECTCNILGTVNNLGCNFYTGECTCKRLVIGRDCNQCMPETYGLSESHDGCAPCDCDPGGSLDNNCDVLTGQCKCRPYMQGQHCSEPRQNHFIPSLHVVLEAESSNTVCDGSSSFGVSKNFIIKSVFFKSYLSLRTAQSSFAIPTQTDRQHGLARDFSKCTKALMSALPSTAYQKQ